MGPSSPSGPSCPRGPGRPRAPGLPFTPSGPLSPGGPMSPGNPSGPGGPGNPRDPLSPTLPRGPGFPRAPGNPGNPWLPLSPWNPVSPDTPGTPCSPFQSGLPHVSHQSLHALGSCVANRTQCSHVANEAGDSWGPWQAQFSRVSIQSWWASFPKISRKPRPTHLAPLARNTRHASLAIRPWKAEEPWESNVAPAAFGARVSYRSR